MPQVDNFKREVPPDPAAPPPEEGVEPEYILPVEVEGDMGDVLSDFKLLQRAGIGFGKPASMRLYLAMKKLLHKNIGAQEGEKIVRVRSWGKVLGLNNDYLVAECVMEGRQPMPAVPEGLPASVVPPDPVGTEFADYLTSANQFVYYVTHAPRNYSDPLSPSRPITPNHPIAALLHLPAFWPTTPHHIPLILSNRSVALAHCFLCVEIRDLSNFSAYHCITRNW